jgi:hypothetical protein
MYRRSITALSLAAILTGLLAGTATAKAGPLPDDLQAVRAAVARYHSYDQALAAGYSVAGEPCVSSPAGTMGIHAVNPALLQSGVIDPLQPPILLYVPRADGLLKLVGVEYFAVALANTENGPSPWFGDEDEAPPLGFFNPAPSLFGQTFDGPMAGHNPAMPWHYDLHAWVVEENPAGVFAEFNPAVSC